MSQLFISKHIGMYKYFYICISIQLCLLILPFNSFSQAKSIDTTIQFTVEGNCGQCKARIEKAGKIKGVSMITWSSANKIAQVTYDPATTSADKIQDKIVAAGHDVGAKKAPENVYKSLPDCCLYRSTDGHGHDHEEVDAAVKGVVMEEDDKGNFKPLPGATVEWLNLKKGATTNSSGIFTITPQHGAYLLVISYAGFRADTLSVTDNNNLVVVLAKSGRLDEVTITSRKRSTYLSALNTMRTQIMSESELFKAACCNLSESFETNPSVDVSYNDAVTGSKQIQLLGLGGAYTQLTVENQPGPRGIAMPLGLNMIPGPWIESIQLTKGAGSVANGFESIAGQINIELKKPITAEKLYFNTYVNNMGKADFNLTLSQTLGKKWSTALLLHDDFLNNHMVDENKDDFRDMPTGNLFTALNRWKYEHNGWIVQFGGKTLQDNRTGGDINFDPAHKGTTHAYGLGIKTNRNEGFAKAGYMFPNKKYKSFGLQLSSFNHEHDSYYGLTVYNATQKNMTANFIYQSIIKTTAHKFRTGVSFLKDRYMEQFNNLNFNRTEAVPGSFFEYTYDNTGKFSVVAGMRVDHHSLYNWFFTPRLHIHWQPAKGFSIRFNAGRGQRTANIFADNSGLMASARQFILPVNYVSNAYGLKPEVAWDKGVTIDQRFNLFSRSASASLEFYRNDFKNQVIVDIENPRVVRFYNLDGRSFSNSFQAEVNVTPLPNLETRLAYRLFDVKSTYSNMLLQKPLLSKHRAFVNLAYTVTSWKFDYTVNYVGQKRIPSTMSNPAAFQVGTESPAFALMNAQVSKQWKKKHDFTLYIGGENLTNFIQKKAIIAATDPFGAYFDASLIWGPVTGRLLYIGMRFKMD